MDELLVEYHREQLNVAAAITDLIKAGLYLPKHVDMDDADNRCLMCKINSYAQSLHDDLAMAEETYNLGICDATDCETFEKHLEEVIDA